MMQVDSALSRRIISLICVSRTLFKTNLDQRGGIGYTVDGIDG